MERGAIVGSIVGSIEESMGWQRVRHYWKLQSCPTLWDLMDCSPLDSSVHGIFLERISEWVSIPSSRGSSWLRDGTRVSCSPKLQVDSLLFESLGKAPNLHGFTYKNLQNLKYIFYLSCKMLLLCQIRLSHRCC